MTSGNLFFKLTWKELKQKIWCPILLCVVFFLTMEVLCLMQFQTIDSAGAGYYQTKLSFFRDEYLMADATGSVISFLMVCSAVLCGLSSFTYLNSRKQIDLYHSLPVHRNILFFSRFISGALCFVVPFLFNLGITFLIALGKGAVDLVVIGRIFVFAGYQIVYFMSIYATVVLAVMLTGNLVLNAIGSAILLSYSPILWTTVMVMNSTFFDTFAGRFYKRPICLSPLQDLVESAIKIGDLRNNELIISYRPVISNLIIEVLVIVVLILIDWRLFLKRPSEASGKSIVFPIAEPVIKTVFLIPVSLLCGTFFMSASSNSEVFAWFLFGSIFGFLFIGIVMEIIYRLDVKSALCHWKYLLLNLAIMLVIVAIYKLDLFGYDKYIPAKEHLDSIAVSIDSLDSQINYSRNDCYIGYDEYRINHMNLKELDVPYELCRQAIEKQSQLMEQSDEVVSYATTTEYIQAMKSKPENEYVYITVAYKQKNGKNIYRTYQIDTLDAQTFDLLNSIYCMEDYKKGVFPLITDTDRQYYQMDCNMAYSMRTLKADKEKMDDFLAIYREELLKLSLKEIHEELPVGSIDLYERVAGRSYYYNDSCGYPLYPSFVKSIAWLREQGIDYTQEQKPNRLLSIRTWNYNQSYMIEDDWSEDANILYEDEDKMNEIMKHVTCTYNLDMGAITPVERWMDVDVEYENEDGVNYRTLYFRKDEIPAFVIQDLDAFVPDLDMMKE